MATFKYNPALIHSSFTKASTLHRWILVQYNTAVAGMEHGFHDYHFADVTSAFYHFWLDSFCDVYVEAVKPLLAANQDVDLINNILFFILENGMRLLHPMMPFLSEELYQKLPVFEGKCESVSVAAYPKSNDAWKGTTENQDIEYIMNVIKQIRSLTSSVNLPNNVKPQVFVNFIEADEKGDHLVREQTELVKTLAKIASLTILKKNEKVIDGCISGITNKSVELHVFVKEFIKVDKELERLEKRRKEIDSLMSKLKEKMSAKDYDKKVPADVQKENKDKVDAFNSELIAIEQSYQKLAQFR
jgi:valyl-tRNA synthetase